MNLYYFLNSLKTPPKCDTISSNMNFLRKIIKHKNFYPLLIIFVFAILAGRTFIFEKGYFNMHDDLQMMRQLEMEKCFLDGQIPCRWVPDMGYGYGFPLFNFYPPLPYLVGEVFRLLHFSFIDTVKLTFALSFILSGITMYLLSKEFFGRWGGVVSSIFYIWAPYHSVDTYVRGAMNEAWALVWFPLILWTSYRLLMQKDRYRPWILGLSLSWVGLLLSHNLMVMIFTPVFGAWCFIFWIKDHKFNKFLQVFISGIFALGLSAFFTIPAITEQKLVHVDTLIKGYYEYIAHYATIGQLLTSRFWGYGPSIWGPNDGMPYQIGQIHWILSLILLALVILLLLKKKFTYTNIVLICSIGLGWFTAFMAHQYSTFIWKRLGLLDFVQFPWRFLTLTILGFSFAAGAIVIFVKKLGKLGQIIVGAIVVLLVTLNWTYFLPQGGKMGPLTDAQKFSGAAWDLQRTAGIFDYLPESAKENPKSGQNKVAEIITGDGTITNMQQGTNHASFDVDIKKATNVRINIFSFPNWMVYVDDKLVQTTVPQTEKWGRMYLALNPGVHKIYAKLTDSTPRKVSNIVSIVAWSSLALVLLFRKKFIFGK